jgi:hypothetical protein
MFDRLSRYAALPIVSSSLDASGRTLPPYVRRRFLPAVSAHVTLVLHTVTAGDRLDNVTARYLGDPSRFWAICDANRVLDPAQATAEIGRVLRIAVPNL